MGPGGGAASGNASLPTPTSRSGRDRKVSAVLEAAGPSQMETNAPGRAVFQKSHWCNAAFVVLMVVCSPCRVESRSYDVSYGSGITQGNLRITCYTCMNVSTNEECNRFAIDRPCPEGRDYCLTLHVMDGLELDRSVLVNKRCAYLDECTGDSTGCTTADGQTQCVSCCDQPYCNDYVPSNETSAMFHRSNASGVLFQGSVTWRLAAIAVTTLILSSWPS